MEHQGCVSDVPLVPMGPSFVDYVLGIVNADRGVRVVEAPGASLFLVAWIPSPRGGAACLPFLEFGVPLAELPPPPRPPPVGVGQE